MAQVFSAEDIQPLVIPTQKTLDGASEKARDKLNSELKEFLNSTVEKDQWPTAISI